MKLFDLVLLKLLEIKAKRKWLKYCDLFAKNANEKVVMKAYHAWRKVNQKYIRKEMQYYEGRTY